jgi:predicted alternative tryptophan synthase beta-subunit
MARCSYDQKPYRASMMRTWGATVHPSPSGQTAAGRAVLAESPDSNGSLGVAISEAVEEALQAPDAHYALGSVLNHVLLHQTVIGLETRRQLGSHFMPPGFHTGGLRYHGMAPMVSAAVEQGLVEPVAVHQLDAFAAGILFAKTEGIVPAPEANHAIRGAIVEAERCKAEGRKQIIAFNLCGHGHMDMSAYDAYLAGKLDNVPTTNKPSPSRWPGFRRWKRRGELTRNEPILRVAE